MTWRSNKCEADGKPPHFDVFLFSLELCFLLSEESIEGGSKPLPARPWRVERNTVGSSHLSFLSKPVQVDCWEGALKWMPLTEWGLNSGCLCWPLNLESWLILGLSWLLPLWGGIKLQQELEWRGLCSPCCIPCTSWLTHSFSGFPDYLSVIHNVISLKLLSFLVMGRGFVSA